MIDSKQILTFTDIRSEADSKRRDRIEKRQRFRKQRYPSQHVLAGLYVSLDRLRV